jgi:hypothetical protein
LNQNDQPSNKQELPYLDIIKIVKDERTALRKTGSRLLGLLKEYNEEKDEGKRNVKQLEINATILEFSEHLGNIAGFCDKEGKKGIHEIILTVLGPSMIYTDYYLDLPIWLPHLIGMDVDFTKKPPFKLIGFEVKALETKIRALLKR